MRFVLFYLSFYIFCSSGLFCVETKTDSPRVPFIPDQRPPATILGGTFYEKGNWALSIQYSQINLLGLRKGTDPIDVIQLKNQFDLIPISQVKEEYGLELLSGFSERMTFFLYAPYVQNTLMAWAKNPNFEDGYEQVTQTSKGVGDFQMGLIYDAVPTRNWDVHLHYTISFPTADFNQASTIGLLGRKILPYGMQLGSGTIDMKPGLSIVRYWRSWRFGHHSAATFRYDQNDKGYALGPDYKSSLWVSKSWTPYWSTAFRISGSYLSGIVGSHADIDADLSPDTAASSVGYKRVNMGVSSNFVFNFWKFKGVSCDIEYLRPSYQNMAGIQLHLEDQFLFALRLDGGLNLGKRK